MIQNTDFFADFGQDMSRDLIEHVQLSEKVVAYVSLLEIV